MSAGDQQGYVLYFTVQEKGPGSIVNCLDYGGDRQKMKLTITVLCIVPQHSWWWIETVECNGSLWLF